MSDLLSHLPLNPRVFAILAVLLEGPAHGYRIRQEVEGRSHGAITLDPGSLYRTVAKLLDDGIIEEVNAPKGEVSDDPRRRYYGVTEFGRQLAGTEAARLRALLSHPVLSRGALEGGR